MQLTNSAPYTLPHPWAFLGNDVSTLTNRRLVRHLGGVGTQGVGGFEVVFKNNEGVVVRMCCRHLLGRISETTSGFRRNHGLSMSWGRGTTTQLISRSVEVISNVSSSVRYRLICIQLCLFDSLKVCESFSAQPHSRAS